MDMTQLQVVVQIGTQIVPIAIAGIEDIVAFAKAHGSAMSIADLQAQLAANADVIAQDEKTLGDGISGADTPKS